jgi:hypothetical protein
LAHRCKAVLTVLARAASAVLALRPRATHLREAPAQAVFLLAVAAAQRMTVRLPVVQAVLTAAAGVALL